MPTVIYVIQQLPCPGLFLIRDVAGCRSKFQKSYGRKWRNLLMKKIGMSLLAVALCGIAFVGVSRAAEKKVTGYVVDEKCSSMPKAKSNVECVKKCAEAGSKLVIASDKGGKIFAVDNQDILKGHEGQHVTVSGAVTGTSIHVSGVAVAPVKS
jgi:hypothetical protein